MLRRILLALKRARVWVVRIAASFLLMTGFLPRSLAVAWWQWLVEDMHPQDPCLPQVLTELAELEAPHA